MANDEQIINSLSFVVRHCIYLFDVKETWNIVTNKLNRKAICIKCDNTRTIKEIVPCTIEQFFQSGYTIITIEDYKLKYEVPSKYTLTDAENRNIKICLITCNSNVKSLMSIAPENRQKLVDYIRTNNLLESDEPIEIGEAIGEAIGEEIDWVFENESTGSDCFYVFRVDDEYKVMKITTEEIKRLESAMNGTPLLMYSNTLVQHHSKNGVELTEAQLGELNKMLRMFYSPELYDLELTKLANLNFDPVKVKGGNEYNFIHLEGSSITELRTKCIKLNEVYSYFCPEAFKHTINSQTPVQMQGGGLYFVSPMLQEGDFNEKKLNEQKIYPDTFSSVMEKHLSSIPVPSTSGPFYQAPASQVGGIFEPQSFPQMSVGKEVREKHIRPVPLDPSCTPMPFDPVSAHETYADYGQTTADAGKTFTVYYNHHFRTAVLIQPSKLVDPASFNKCVNVLLGEIENVDELRLNRIEDADIISAHFGTVTFDSVELLRAYLNDYRDKGMKMKVEVDEITAYLKRCYEIGNDVANRVKFTDLLNQIVKGLNVHESYSTNLKNKLPFIMKEMGLQKRRYSDGMYWYGLKSRKSSPPVQRLIPEKTPIVGDEEYYREIEARFEQQLIERTGTCIQPQGFGPRDVVIDKEDVVFPILVGSFERSKPMSQWGPVGLERVVKTETPSELSLNELSLSELSSEPEMLEF